MSYSSAMIFIFVYAFYDKVLSVSSLHCRLGLLGSQFSYGVDRKISEHSKLGASMTIGSLTGVVLKIR